MADESGVSQLASLASFREGESMQFAKKIYYLYATFALRKLK
jgi:hypothetical protein